MNISEIVRNLEQTEKDLEQQQTWGTVVSSFEKVCQEFNDKLNAIQLFAGKREIKLDEDWTYAHLVGFIFCGNPYAWHWRGNAIRVYIGLAKILKERNQRLFAKLPDFSDFTSKMGNVLIARDPSRLNKPRKLDDEVFFESNLNNELKRTTIKSLLRIYEIDHSEVQFFLHH